MIHAIFVWPPHRACLGGREDWEERRRTRVFSILFTHGARPWGSLDTYPQHTIASHDLEMVRGAGSGSVNPLTPREQPTMRRLLALLLLLGCLPWPAATNAATNAPVDIPAPPAVALPETVLDQIVVVRGTQGSGTGFIAGAGSNTYLYSNVHVLMGNRGMTFTNSRGTRFKPLAFEAASDRDLVRITIANPPADGLRIIEPRGLQQPVVVCGNAEGEEVMRQIGGLLVGIGPAKVETSAKFVKGHSGSPILTTNGAVLGIATYVRRANTDWVNTNTPFTVTRRFGYRVDNVPGWVRVQPKRFADEAGLIQAREAHLETLTEMISLWANNPYWIELPPEALPQGLPEWVRTHNQWVDDNKRRMRTARADSSKVRELTRDFHLKLKGEIEALKAEINKLKYKPPPQWHLRFFANYWADLDEWQASLLKGIDYLQTLHTSYDPVELRSQGGK